VLERYRVVGEPFHERVDGGIRLAGLGLPACKARHADRAERGGGRDGPSRIHGNFTRKTKQGILLESPASRRRPRELGCD
jgi:hypothetical protein